MKNQEKLETLKSAVTQAYMPVLDISEVKAGLLAWLSRIKFPAYPNASSWEGCIKEYPDQQSEKDNPASSAPAIKLRLSLKLHTSRHNYLLTIIEPSTQTAEVKGIIAVHSNLDEKEDNILQALDAAYQQRTGPSFHAKQTLWIESFSVEQIAEALNGCALAILGHELLGTPFKEVKPTLKNLHPLKANFPE